MFTRVLKGLARCDDDVVVYGEQSGDSCDKHGDHGSKGDGGDEDESGDVNGEQHGEISVDDSVEGEGDDRGEFPGGVYIILGGGVVGGGVVGDGGEVAMKEAGELGTQSLSSTSGYSCSQSNTSCQSKSSKYWYGDDSGCGDGGSMSGGWCGR